MKAKKIPSIGVSDFSLSFGLQGFKSLKFAIIPSFIIFDIVVLFSFFYFYPRFLSEKLGEASPWISYFYTYGLGALVFTISSLWIFSRKYKYEERKKEELSWLTALCLGFFFVFLLHGTWIFLSISYPFKA